MRSSNRRRRRRSGKKNAGGMAVTCLGTILVIALAVFLLRGCVLKISDMFNNVGDSILRQQYPIKYEKYVNKYSREYDVDKFLIYAVIKTESGFDQYAVSRAGAYGLMQVQEETAGDCAERLDMEIALPDDLYEPDINIHIGTYYLSWLLDMYGGDISLAVAAYNAGIGNVEKWLEDGGGELSYIPFPETRNYVEGVNNSYEKYKEIYG